jgi:hypothetical protein
MPDRVEVDVATEPLLLHSGEFGICEFLPLGNTVDVYEGVFHTRETGRPVGYQGE